MHLPFTTTTPTKVLQIMLYKYKYKQRNLYVYVKKLYYIEEKNEEENEVERDISLNIWKTRKTMILGSSEAIVAIFVEETPMLFFLCCVLISLSNLFLFLIYFQIIIIIN